MDRPARATFAPAGVRRCNPSANRSSARPPLTLPELLQLQGRLQEQAGLPVDLVSLDDAPIVLAHEIVEGGRCLYARTPDDETEVVTRTRMRWWDWLPVREHQWQASGERLEGRLGPST